MRRLALIVCAFALGGCAVTNTSYPSPAYSAPSVARPPASTLYNYAAVPRAPLHSELFTCNRYGSNLGEIGLRGEAAGYAPYMDTPAGPLMRTPVEIACLSSGYGWRGASSSGRLHNGLDLANAEGGFIYAAGEGRIVSADWRGGYGNFVEIDHGRGVHTRYAHLAEIDPNFKYVFYYSAGVLGWNLNRLEEATLFLEEGIRRHPREWRFHQYLAALAFQKDHNVNHLVDFLQTFSQEPECPNLLRSILANIYKKQHRYKEAIQIWTLVYNTGDPTYQERSVSQIKELYPLARQEIGHKTH